MPTVYMFNAAGDFTGLDFVDDNYEPGEFEAVVPDGEEINFHKFALRDGELVEGLTPEEIAERTKPIEQQPSQEDRIAQLEQENKLLKAQKNALTERTDFHEEVLTEIILTINP